MNKFPKSRSLAAAAFAVLALVATTNANADQPQQVTQAARPPALALPEVVVRRPPPEWFYDPYTSGHAEKASSLNHRAYEHFKVPVGYDSNVMMHPYSTGMGPCTEGASPSQGCHHVTATPIPSSHYKRPPFNQ